MTVTPKKVCFLHFSCSPHSSTRPNCLYNLCSKSGQKIDQEFDFAQVRPLFFSGKKPDPENPVKIWIRNSGYFWSDFKNGIHKIQFYGKTGKFFLQFLLILTFSKSRFVGSNVQILEKVCQICISHKILIDISQS